MQGKKASKRHREIAGRLLLLREKLYGNASEMARSMSLTPQRWFNYETGRRALDVDTAAIVVEQHGVDFNWLYGGRVDTLKPKLRKLLLSDAKQPRPASRSQRARPPRKSRKPQGDQNGNPPT